MVLRKPLYLDSIHQEFPSTDTPDVSLINYQAKSADYTVVVSDRNSLIVVNASAAARTITLPSATAAGAGFSVVIRKAIADTTLNTVTIARAGSDTIDGATSFLLYVPTESVTLVSDGGTNWLALDYYFPETRNPAFFGDGNDGNGTISTTQSLSVSRVYGDLTITNTGTLNCAGYILYVSGTLKIDAGGIIQELGNNASGATAGAALPTAVLGGASAGGAGGSGVAGSNGGAASAGGIPGSGGAGGISGTGSAGGTGGSATLSADRIIRAYPATALGFAINSGTFNVQLGGGGGGGGGGGASSVGGGGGSGARNIVIVANRIINNGTIRSQGGNGANGTGTNAGGGGSGGGGAIYITTRHFVGNTPTSLAGTPGTAVGSGVAGVSGGTGVVNIYRL